VNDGREGVVEDVRVAAHDRQLADDARGSMVRLTPAGRSAIEAAAPNHVAAVRRLFIDNLSDDEVDTLTALFDRLLAGLANPDTLTSPTGGGRDAVVGDAGLPA
jgi:hypothetical protein